LARSSVVLSLENVLALSRPGGWKALLGAARQNPTANAKQGPNQNAVPGASPKGASSLGFQFVNVARESGLNAKTIFGGEHKNKYLLETTGCGVAFYD